MNHKIELMRIGSLINKCIKQTIQAKNTNGMLTKGKICIYQIPNITVQRRDKFIKSIKDTYKEYISLYVTKQTKKLNIDKYNFYISVENNNLYFVFVI